MTNPYAPPQAAVEDIADPQPVSSFADRGTRLGASILDGLIFGLMVYLAVPGRGRVQRAAAGSPGREPDFGPVLQIGLGIALIGFVVWLGFTIKFMAANGQSIGKKASGIKVVRRDGSPAAVSRLILLRNVVNMALSLIPLYGIIDALFIFGERGAACTTTLPTPSSSRRDDRPSAPGSSTPWSRRRHRKAILLELRPAGLSARFYAFALDG
jgi:uncharacterized RDD family membrane protein YckC